MQHSRKPLTISIVIPARNEAVPLRRCLDSLAAQTVMPYEVIVVDNGSRDATAEVARQYEFVRIIHEPRPGIVHARSAGFDMARSTVIARIDADTIAPEHWVETIQSFYAQPGHGNSVFTGGCYFYNLRTGRLIGHSYNFVVHHINRLLIGYYTPWGSNCAFPAAAWRKIRRGACRRTDIHEDLDLGLHLRRAGHITYYDATMRVGARAGRIVTDHGKLWSYIMMWPRTLRSHGVRTWPAAWSIGALVWVGSYGIIAAEKLVPRKTRRTKNSAYEASLDI